MSLLEQTLTSFKQQDLIGKEWRNYFGEQLTKTTQAVLTLFLVKMISLGKNLFTFQQRTLASQLNTHYNSIYNALNDLQGKGHLEKEGKNRQTTIVMNLEKVSLLSSLSLLSSSFKKKLLESDCQQVYDEKKKAENIEQLPVIDKQLAAQLTFLLEKKEGLAKELTLNIIQAVREADNRTIQILSSEDYHMIISQEFENVFEQFDVRLSPRTSPSSETIRLTNAKLGKL